MLAVFFSFPFSFYCPINTLYLSISFSLLTFVNTFFLYCIHSTCLQFLHLFLFLFIKSLFKHQNVPDLFHGQFHSCFFSFSIPFSFIVWFCYYHIRLLPLSRLVTFSVPLELFRFSYSYTSTFHSFFFTFTSFIFITVVGIITSQISVDYVQTLILFFLFKLSSVR